MPIAERIITMLAQWAKGAQTNIPTPPVPGVAYRNAALTLADFELGQVYDKVYDSARYNQRDYIITGLLQLVEQFGGLPWSSLTNYPEGGFAIGLNKKLYQALQISGPGVAGVGAKVPGAAGSEAYWLDFAMSVTPPAPAAVTKYDLCEFYGFRHPTLKPGFQPAHGGLIANAATLFPKAWAYLQTVEGQKLCKTEAEWQAMVNAFWHTNADGSRVGWNGIGGAPFYVVNTGAGTLRMPDLRGMYAEAAGFDSLGVGGVHGDGMRNITGQINVQSDINGHSGAFSMAWGAMHTVGGSVGAYTVVILDTSRVTPVAAKNQPRAWGSLACVCLDPSAS